MSSAKRFSETTRCGARPLAGPTPEVIDTFYVVTAANTKLSAPDELTAMVAAVTSALEVGNAA